MCAILTPYPTALTLILAIAANSDPSMILMALESNDKCVRSLGNWLQNGNYKDESCGGLKSENKPYYCNQATDDDAVCFAGKDSDCCKALESKCTTTKVFGVLAAFFTAVSLVGFAQPKFGASVAVLAGFCYLIVFSIWASLMNGDLMDGVAANKDSDCGYNGTPFYESPRGGVAFGLTIACCLLSFAETAAFWIQ